MPSRLEDMQNVRECMVNYDGLSNKLLDEFFSRSLLLSTIRISVQNNNYYYKLVYKVHLSNN